LGSGTGIVTLTFNAFAIPDRYVVTYNGVVVIDTGYRGARSQSRQTELNAALAARGLPPSTIVGPGIGSASFLKTSSVAYATVQVYAPMPGTAWNYTLSCPA
jgi:hypothetical protein